MILLLGGTSETAPIAEGLAKAGYRILVSCATDIALNTGCHNNIIRRRGALDAKGLVGLIESERITLLVDATHPYATEVHRSAQEAANVSGIPYLSYLRPQEHCTTDKTVRAPDHLEAARMAFTYGKAVLLTTGAKHVAPYVMEAKKTGVPIVVRVLPEPSSIEACRAQGIPEERIIGRRGPFSIEENRETIRKYSIGVLVTKESGKAGGVSQKMEAARLEECAVVLVERPAIPDGKAFDNVKTLIAYVITTYPIDIESGCSR